MAQKKKASAARSATVHAPAPSSQLGSPPVQFISSTSYEGDTGGVLAPPELQPGTGQQISSPNIAGGEPKKREASIPGRGDSIGKAHGGKGAGVTGAPSSNRKVPPSFGMGAAVTSNGKEEAASSAAVRGECERALVALRRGNSTKALRLVKDACIRDENSGLAHRVQGHIYMRLASVIEDTNTKQRHFGAALESARKAASLSPQSVEYAHFYAQLLYEAAKDSKGYEEVVRECERALLIDDPVDPAKESLHNEKQQELPTAEARIAHVQQELKGLVQKVNITSISTWMKTLGNGAGEEKLRFIQMRKFADQDPMEQRVSQPKRPHEVKKIVKTPEERRKEIEVRVAAARLLQQRENLVAHLGTEATEEPEKSLLRRLDKRKSSGPNSRRFAKTLSTEERIDRVRQFWHVLPAEKRETMLEVSIADLKDHPASWRELGGIVKSHAAVDALSEALEFAQEKKTWRFWACCKCGERFIDYQDLIHHAMEEHIGSLPQKLQQVIPQDVDQDWVDHLLDDDCRPVDGAAAVRMLIESAHFPLPDELQTSEIALPESEMKELEKSDAVILKDTDETISKGAENLGAFEDIEAGVGQEMDVRHSHTCNGDCQKLKNLARAGKEMPPQDLPFVENEERRKLLEKIHVLFKVLIRNKCLAHDHVVKIIQYATEEVQSLVPDPTVHYEFNQSPLYIRFLESLPLQHIHKYLTELAQACGLSRLSECTVPPRTAENGEEEIIQDRLFLNEDFTQLLLDERVLKEFPEEVILPSEKLEDGEARETVVEKGEAARRPPLPLMKGKDGEIGATHVDLQLSWLYGSMDYEYQPPGWKQYREEQGQQGRDVCRLLQKEFQQLQTLCEKKFELVSYEEALNLAERLCIDENKRRELQADGTCKSYETLLKQRQQELVDAGVNSFSPRKLELDAISNVLRDAQTGMVRRHPYDGTLGVRVSDSDEDDEEAWRMQKSMHRADSRIDGVILRQREQLSNEINHVDAKIMKTMDNLQKMEIKLGQAAVLDYRAVVLPLVKSLLKSRLEVEADKDAMLKSDAAQEAFLAELAKDQKSPGGTEVEPLKLSRDKSKERKKVKDQKKSKDVKRGTITSGQDKEQQGDGVSVTPEDVDEADSWDWVGQEDLRPQYEAEIQHQAELWEDERKLAEALELQRRMEDEVKEKYLAEQEQKKLAQEVAMQHIEDGGEIIGTVSSPCKDVDKISLTKMEAFGEGNTAWPSFKQTCSDGPTTLIDSTITQAEVLVEASQCSTSFTYAQSISASSEIPASDLKVPQIAVEWPSSEVPALLESEQQQGKDTCKRTLEKVGCVGAMSPNSSPSSNGFPPSEDGDHLTVLQKKSRGGGSRNRRKRGPRIHAEEGMPMDQEAKITKASGSSDGSQPLLRQNASKGSGTFLANGTHETYPLLLLPAPPHPAEGIRDSKKTLRQLQAEQDDEERFQADLQQAMRQSLDMLTLHSRKSADTSSVVPYLPRTASSNGTCGKLTAQQLAKVGISETTALVGERQTKDVEEVGKGLRNEIGQYNCFLNAVIQVIFRTQDCVSSQREVSYLGSTRGKGSSHSRASCNDKVRQKATSLWHLRRFREELLVDASMQHVHVGDPCVVCALRDVFVGLNTAACDGSSKDAVAPTALRVALSAMYSDSNFFQVAQMNDASEVLAVIFDRLHKAFVPNASLDGNSESSTARGSWDCQGEHPCMAHSLFGLDIAEQMNCQGCSLESRHLKYTAFFHNINASALRTAKVLYPDSSMDELLKVVDMNHQLACDVETGGCGRQNHIHHLLHAAPHVFTIVLGWQNGRESFEDISVTVDAIDVGLDVGVVYRGLDEGSRHRLVSIVCYYGQHYHCFAYNQELARWVMFDDSTVKVIGEWTEVASTCRRGHLQPQVLFYQAVPAT